MLLGYGPSDRHQRSNSDFVGETQEFSDRCFFGREQGRQRRTKSFVATPQQHVLDKGVERTSANDALTVEVLICDGERPQLDATDQERRNIGQ